MGTWDFIYYPTGTEPGASFTGFWLTEMNEIPSSGVPGEPSQSRELNELVLAGSQAQEEAALGGSEHLLGGSRCLLLTEGKP